MPWISSSGSPVAAAHVVAARARRRSCAACRGTRTGPVSAEIGSASWPGGAARGSGSAPRPRSPRRRRRAAARAAAARTRAAARRATSMIVALVVDVPDRARARDGRPVVEPDLDADRAPAPLLALQALARARWPGAAGSPRAAAWSAMSVSNVVSLRARLRHARRSTAASRRAGARGGAARALARAEAPPAAALVGRALSSPSVGMPSARQPLGGLRADAGHEARRAAGRSARTSSRADGRRSPRACPASEATLATSWLGPMPDRDLDARLLADLARQRAQRGLRRVDARSGRGRPRRARPARRRSRCSRTRPHTVRETSA